MSSISETRFLRRALKNPDSSSVVQSSLCFRCLVLCGVVVSWLAVALAVELLFVALVVDAGTGGERDLAEEEEEDEEDEEDEEKEEVEVEGSIED